MRAVQVVAVLALVFAATTATAGGGAQSGGGGGASPVPAATGTAVDPAGSANAATGAPVVAIGAPYDGSWTPSDSCPAAYPSDVCGEPDAHRVRYASLSGTPEQQSWATDLYPSLRGAQVRLYAQAQSLSVPVTATIQRVASACSGASAGQVVVVAISSRGVKIGSVAYAHVVPAAGIQQGRTIPPWGTVLGTVGTGYASSACWQRTHTEIELGNVRNAACVTDGWQAWPGAGQRMFERSTLGYIGGNLASVPRSACATDTVYNLGVCPVAGMTTPTGWSYPECAADSAGAAFSTGTGVACSAETAYASAHRTGMKILQGSAVVASFQDKRRISGPTHWYVWASWSPNVAPGGAYRCQVLVDGKVAQSESFTLTGR